MFPYLAASSVALPGRYRVNSIFRSRHRYSNVNLFDAGTVTLDTSYYIFIVYSFIIIIIIIIMMMMMMIIIIIIITIFEFFYQG